jgi:hypothetical protein
MHLHIISNADPTTFNNSHIASYRLRLSYLYDAAIQLGYKVTGGLKINNKADIYYIGKVTGDKVNIIHENIKELRKNRKRILVDYTDNILHYKGDESRKAIYEELIQLQSFVTVPVEGLAEYFKKRGKRVFVIPDGIDKIPNINPNTKNNEEKNILWHGHNTNINSLIRIINNELGNYIFNLHIVSNHLSFEILKQIKFKKLPKCKPIAHLWSIQKLASVSAKCDFAILPTDKKWASANRLITNFRLGLPSIAETISSYKKYSNFYAEFDKKNIIEMFNSPESWYQSVIVAQKKITEDFDQEKLTNLWKGVLKNNLKHNY